MSRYAAPLRDLVHGRVRDHGRRLRGFDDDDWRRYGLLLTAAFRLAVDRRFRAGQDRAPVIRFVASVRERYDVTGYEVDPVLAESLVWAALDERPPVPLDRAAVAAQALLLVGLVCDEGLGRAELDAFLASAEALVETAESVAAAADKPTDKPTAEPTDKPTAEPTAEPADTPTAEPTTPTDKRTA